MAIRARHKTSGEERTVEVTEQLGDRSEWVIVERLRVSDDVVMSHEGRAWAREPYWQRQAKRLSRLPDPAGETPESE